MLYSQMEFCDIEVCIEDNRVTVCWIVDKDVTPKMIDRSRRTNYGLINGVDRRFDGVWVERVSCDGWKG